MTQRYTDVYTVPEAELIFMVGEFTPDEFVHYCRIHDDGYEVAATDVQHTMGRWIPCWEHGEFLGLYLDYPVPQKRGAFRVTYAERYIDLWEQNHPAAPRPGGREDVR